MKKLYKILSLIIILLVPCAIFFGCGAKVQSITFTESTKTILVDETYKLEVVIDPIIENAKITYSIADTTIAYLLPNGETVLGLKEGQTKIYARSDNGIIAEMTLSVVSQRTPLSTPTGFIFEKETKTIKWIAVLNAYSYEVSLLDDGQVRKYEVFNNSFCLEDFELYNEYTEYNIQVVAKPSPTSKVYFNSASSETFSLKQIYAVSNLTYLNNKIEFTYNLASLNLQETGQIFFNLEILKDGESVVRTTINSTNLENNKTYFSYVPNLSGEYIVKVYASCENLQSSKTNEIKIVKLAKPLITTDGTVVNVSGEENALVKYFKILDGISQEISADDLTVDELENGQEVVYEAYSYMQNNQNVYYLNSDIATFTIKKLEAPENIIIENISGNKNSVKIIWGAFFPIDDYIIYVNGQATSKTSYALEEDLYKVVISNFNEEGIYRIQIVTHKNDIEGIKYLDSISSEELTVVKLAKPNVQYDELSKKFILTSSEINLGATFNFNANYNNQEFTLVNELISNETKQFTLAGLNIDEGICATISNVSRISGSNKLVYLDSENCLFNLEKLVTPELSYTYSNQTNGKVIVSWPEIENTGLYLIQIKNITNNVLETYSGSSITQNNGIVSIEIDLFENGKDYEIYIKALPLTTNKTEAGVKTQFIESEISTLRISRLDSPNLEITGKAEKAISFAWEAVEGATAYDIYMDNQFLVRSTQLTHTIPGMGFGNHSFAVIAISSANGIIPCGIDLTNLINYYVLDKVKNISYEKISETASKISFDEVVNAGGYKLIIRDTENNEYTYTSFSLLNGKVNFIIATADIFNIEGEYSIFGFALSEVQNIVENYSTEKELTMLKQISSINIDENQDYITWEYIGELEVSGYEIYINESLITNYEFLDNQGLVQMRYYVGNLASGVHSIRIIAKGDNISTIDSLPFSSEIYKKENLATPSMVSFGLKDSGVYSEFELTFREVQYANYYVIYVVDIDKNVIYSAQIDSLNGSTITYLLDRNVFEHNKVQYIYVRAFAVDNPVYLNSAIPNFTNVNEVIKVHKAAEINELTVDDETTINLYGLQALINSQLYSNLTLSIPTLNGGDELSFIVRRLNTYLDVAVNNTFYMASDWKTFKIIKLESPSINIDEETITWENLTTNNILSYEVAIHFFGLDEILDNTKVLTLSVNDNSLTYNQIIDLITENLNYELYNYVGNYQIEVYAVPIGQENQKIYLSSEKAILDFIISENLNNNLISGNILPEGVVELSFTKNNSYFLSNIEFLIQQGENETTLQLFLNGNYNIIGNSLNGFANDFYYITENNNVVYLYIDIQQVLNEGGFSINWKTIGDGVYANSAPDYNSIASYKLKTPILEYESDEHGNRIIIREEIYSSYDEHVMIYAKYNGQELAFTNGFLILPYEWEDVSEIYVYAIKNLNNNIMSDSVPVTATLYNTVTNIRLENENNSGSINFDKTFLRWNSQDTETSWIVYINHNQGQWTIVVGSRELELSSQVLPYSGEYLFRISACGSENMNSNLVDFIAVKLDPELTLSNSNGVFNWSLNSNIENKLSYFRIKIDGNIKITHNTDTFSNTLQSYSGLFGIQMKLVGDVSKNIISSEYTDVVYFYKFATPTTFNISEGQFSFGQEADNNVTNNLFRIVINGNTYTYVDNGTDENISSFYGANIDNGTAFAFINGGGITVINNDNILTLSSNKASISFSRLIVDSVNEEKYLNQANLGEAEIATYFNWKWVEAGNITNRRAIIYIKPTRDIYATDIAGWTKVMKGNGFVDYFCKTIDVSATYSAGNTTMSVVLELPKTLTASSYVINVQKTDSSSGGIYLASKLTSLIKFTQLARPILTLTNGRLTWYNISGASGFLLSYSGNDLGGERTLGIVTNFELDASFADSNNAKLYSFKIVALGNVPNNKVIVGDEHEYIVSSQTSADRSVVKPRTAGNLKLEDGGLKWDESYHVYRGIDAMLELVVFDSASNFVTKVDVKASEFNTLYPNRINVLEKYFPKGAFRAGESYTIQYRELGFYSCANSEYKQLINNIAGGPSISYVFKIAPTISEINISNSGLSWRPISTPIGDLTTIYYDIFFKLQNGNYVYATTVTSTTSSPRSSITMENLKSVGAFTTYSGEIIGMFITVRGDSKNYISGFNSAMVDVKFVNGEIGLFVENGIIKWNSVDGAEYYQIKTIINNETIIYEIYQEDSEYYLNKYIDEVLTPENTRIRLTSLSLENGIWSWEWAKDQNIEANTKYDLNIRYIPEVDSGTFAIPGEYTKVALSVYKLASAQPTIVDGNLTWEPITNAEKYKVYIKYLNAEGELIEELEFETILTNLSVTILNKGQASVQIAVQAIASSSSENNNFYINPVVEYNDVQYKNNSVENFTREKDAIEWTDQSNNLYEIVIYDIEGHLKGSYVTSNKYYDLSSLDLSSLLDYIVFVKVKGTTGTIGLGESAGYLSSSINTAGIAFKVLSGVEYIGTLNGEIIWKAVGAQNTYKVNISSGGNKYIYTIGLINSEYKVLSLTKNGYTIAFTSYVSTYTDNGLYIKFWPAEIDEQVISTCAISMIGREQGGIYYVSSKQISLGSSFIKLSSTSLDPSYSYNSLTGKVNFTWRKFSGYVYDIIIEALDGTVIFSTTTQSLNSFEYSPTLGSGTYRFKVQRYSASSNALNLKSNYAEIQFVVPEVD